MTLPEPSSWKAKSVMTQRSSNVSYRTTGSPKLSVSHRLPKLPWLMNVLNVNAATRRATRLAIDADRGVDGLDVVVRADVADRVRRTPGAPVGEVETEEVSLRRRCRRGRAAGFFFGCLLCFFPAAAASIVEAIISARSTKWRARFKWVSRYLQVAFDGRCLCEVDDKITEQTDQPRLGKDRVSPITPAGGQACSIVWTGTGWHHPLTAAWYANQEIAVSANGGRSLGQPTPPAVQAGGGASESNQPFDASAPKQRF